MIFWIYPFIGCIVLSVYIVYTQRVRKRLISSNTELSQTVDEYQRVLKQLEDSQDRVSEVEHIAHLGSWSWDIAAEEMRWSEEVFHIYGLINENRNVSFQTYLNIIHPDDRPLVQSAIDQALRREHPYNVEHRISRPSGEIRVVSAKGVITFDTEGQPIYMTGTVLDITDYDKVRRKLSAAKAEAEEMIRLKTAFLSNMSHEVRTPLTAIIGCADILAGQSGIDQEKLVDIIRQSGLRLLNTLNSILDLSVLEAGGFQLDYEVFNVTEVVHGLILPYQQLAEKHSLGFTLEAGEGEIWIKQDKTLLNRVLNNLLDNALKFTLEGKINVEVCRRNDHVEIAITDTGVGISSEYLPHIFEGFRQESIGLDREFEGSGLGLALSKGLVTLMEGEISIESEKGKGSTVTIHLPGLIDEMNRADGWLKDTG